MEQHSAVLSEIPEAKVFDARAVSCANKHQLIFGRFAETPLGDYFVLLNDHRPVPLQRQFERVVPGAFRWTELGSGRNFCAVRIDRLAADPAGGGTAEPIQLPGGCGEEVLAWIEIDLTSDAVDAAVARVLRTAGALKPWAGLRVFMAAATPQFADIVRRHGFNVAFSEAGARPCYHIRRH